MTCSWNEYKGYKEISWWKKQPDGSNAVIWEFHGNDYYEHNTVTPQFAHQFVHRSQENYSMEHTITLLNVSHHDIASYWCDMRANRIYAPVAKTLKVQGIKYIV